MFDFLKNIFGPATKDLEVSDNDLPAADHLGVVEDNDNAAAAPASPKREASNSKSPNRKSPAKVVAAAGASPAAKKPEESSEEEPEDEVERALAAGDEATITIKALKAYLTSKNVAFAPSLKKDKLIGLARNASSSAAPAAESSSDDEEPAKKASSTRRSASSKAGSKRARSSSSPAKKKDTPDNTWTLARIKTYADEQGIKLAKSVSKADALKKVKSA